MREDQSGSANYHEIVLMPGYRRNVKPNSHEGVILWIGFRDDRRCTSEQEARDCSKREEKLEHQVDDVQLG